MVDTNIPTVVSIVHYIWFYFMSDTKETPNLEMVVRKRRNCECARRRL